MDDLTAFLVARLDEKEKRIGYVHDVKRDAEPFGGTGRCVCGWPARMHREVEAMRAIVALHGRMSILPGHPMFNDAHLTTLPMTLCRSCEPETMWRRERSWPCRTLLTLAAVWSNHPDYRPEWKAS